MKRRTLMAMAAVAVVGAATYAGAAAGIKGTKHDLSFAAPGANQTDQVCVFCHTPHNAVQPVPLWNRNASANAAGSFKLYTSSQTLDGAQAATGFSADSISLFCMSCHDGSALGGAMIGAEPVGVAAGELIPDGGDTADKLSKIAGTANFGTDLTKSHPVNLSYNEGAGAGQDAGLVAKGSLRFPLYKAGGVENFLECASCHAVHGQDNAANPGDNYPKFLRSTMAGSALCLGCHIK